MAIKPRLLSVIVPAYRQGKGLRNNIKRIELSLRNQSYPYEIICVVDGNADNSLQEARKIKSRAIRIFGYQKNRGKGYAVRYGMARAKGDLVAFIDAGMDINPLGIAMLLNHMEWYGSDIIVGSIRHSASKVNGYPWKRRIYSWGYHWLTRILFGLRITDSQRGLKIFQRQVLVKVLPRLLVKKYAFDIEMLAVAYHLGFRRIHDGPVELNGRRMNYTSSVGAKTVINMLWDTLAVFYRLRIRHYYDDSGQRRWRYDRQLNFRVNID